MIYYIIMINSLVRLRYFAIALILTTMVLPVFPAKADQIFAYSDDLSSNFNLDMIQTGVKFIGGKAYTADDSVSSAITSDIIANPSKAIISARLDVSNNIPSNARVIYYLSNNNGQRWMQINPGYTYLFDSVGNQLRWKAAITRDSLMVGSASIDSVSLTYTVSDTLTVNQNNIYNNSAYGGINGLGSGGDLNTFVCNALSRIGLGCGTVPPATYVQSTQTVFPVSATAITANSNNASNASSGSGNNSGLTATIYNAGTKNTNGNGSGVILVRIPKHEEIYEIIGGKKHLIPTQDIFYDYGFTDSMIQPITQQQLDRYSRVKVIQVAGDKKKNYYLTEGNMIRLIPHKTVSESYGDREEDIVIISKKEFNYYPQNQFVFLENPLNRDVFQVLQGKTKRYITPQAVKRMKIDSEQIAPINQIELATYKTEKPIIL